MKFKNVAKMLCFAMVTTKALSACSNAPTLIENGSTVVGYATGLDEENLMAVATGVTNGARAVDDVVTQAANKGLEVAVAAGDYISGNSATGAEAVPATTPDLPPELQGEGLLSVHFIDVGQGDSILLEYEGENGPEYALIDAGDNDKGTTVQKYLQDMGVERLKYLILTHPDADHIGGADVIISKFDIDNIFMSSVTKDTATYRDVIDAMEYRSYTWSTPDVGTIAYLGDAQLEILAAPSEYEDVNNDSLVVKATYGEASFLFMGDAEFEEEEELLDRFAKVDDTLDVDVLKAGHHGSYTSSSNEFIAEVTPEWTVISCGMDNQYGHPHATSLYNIADYESALFRTDVQGTIVCVTNGTDYTWDKMPTDCWKTGEELLMDDIECER